MVMRADTTRDGYKKWSKPLTVLRLGLGVEKSAYTELGLARHTYFYNDCGIIGHAYYTSITWSPQILPVKDRDIFGLKAGYETDLNILALAIEAKYQTDGKTNDAIITPKIGFGVSGLVQLCYGYNISFAGYPFPGISHNQYSIVINLNKRLLNLPGDKITSCIKPT
jgi:hypothetical protein